MSRLRAIVLTGGILGGFLFAFAGGVAWDRHVQSRVLQEARNIIDSQAQDMDQDMDQELDRGPAEDGRYDDDPDGEDAGADGSDADDGGSCDAQEDDGQAVSI